MYGGPFTHEVDAIRDERNRAAVMGVKPNFDRIFADVELSDGAKEVIADIKRPLDKKVFVPHDYSHEPTKNVKREDNDKEETPAEGTGKEESPKGNKGEKKDATQQEHSSVGALDKILEGQ